ncbi:MAG: glutamate--tRNA ligase [Candidatus Krumholzibacteriia bacterium]
MSDGSRVRVRFAPSPTGALHVGGARTALFNWLYARSQGGSFVLRIEDTDRQRSTEESYAAILRGLEWLGLDWDEGPGVGGAHGPYLQSERLPFYRQALEDLVARDGAYRCWCTEDELAGREAAVKESRGSWDGYDGHCRELGPEQLRSLAGSGQPCAWRLRTPAGGGVFWYDLVVGKREFQTDHVSDRVIFKADGFPTYNFAVVVDDHLMEITHVLRGDDHVSNTPFQLLIYDALGWERPKFGHMPMILGPDRKRLSKRHGATSVEEFRAQGIVPDAMINYLALLGWTVGASGDEVLAREQLIKKFSLKKVGSSPAAFDYEKLEHINAQHLKRLDAGGRRALTMPLLAQQGWSYHPGWLVPGVKSTEDYVDRILAVLGGRFSSLLRLTEQLAFFFHEAYPVDEEAWREKVAPPEARAHLAALASALAERLPPDAPVTGDRFEEMVRAVAEARGAGAGELIHPVRVAVTGQTRSAGVFDVMELVGLPRVRARLERAAGG